MQTGPRHHMIKHGLQLLTILPRILHPPINLRPQRTPLILLLNTAHVRDHHAVAGFFLRHVEFYCFLAFGKRHFDFFNLGWWFFWILRYDFSGDFLFFLFLPLFLFFSLLLFLFMTDGLRLLPMLLKIGIIIIVLTTVTVP